MARYSVAHCKKMIAMIEAAMTKSVDAVSYTINGRSLSRMSAAELQKLMDLWADRLTIAMGGNGGILCRSIIVHDA